MISYHFCRKQMKLLSGVIIHWQSHGAFGCLSVKHQRLCSLCVDKKTPIPSWLPFLLLWTMYTREETTAHSFKRWRWFGGEEGHGYYYIIPFIVCNFANLLKMITVTLKLHFVVLMKVLHVTGLKIALL